MQNQDSHTKITFSILIPAHNEAHTIGNIITEIKQTFGEDGNKYEIIVIDDSSLDNTALVAKNFGVKKVIRMKKGFNKIRATLIGARYASSDIIVTLDADGYYNPNDIPKLLYPIINNDAEAVIGGAFYPENKMHISFFKSFFTKIISLLVSSSLKINLTDVFSSFRAFNINNIISHRNIQYLPHIKYDLEFNFFLFSRISDRKKIKEIPIQPRYRESYGHSFLKYRIGMPIIKLLTMIIKWRLL